LRIAAKLAHSLLFERSEHLRGEEPMSLHNLIVASLLGASVAVTAPAGSAANVPARRHDAGPPGIRLWTSHGETYRRGERVQVFFRTEQDAFVTVLRVDSDGRVRVLFPREPWEDNRVRGGYTYDVPNYGRHDAFVVDDDPGVGYVFGVASADPFRFEPFSRSNHWDLALASDGGRIHGDPYQALAEMVQRILPPDYADYDTHLLPYYVEQHYDYPRFLCYDCHTYVGFSAWNPYSYWCPRFTLFVYRDPFYYYPSYWYPSRYYGGTRVVYTRPFERGSQYIFKAREDQSAPAIAYRDRSRENQGERRAADRGVRGADIGAAGTVPVPGGRRMVGDPGGASGYVGGRTPEARVPMVPGNAQVPGRRDGPVPIVTPDATKPSANPGGGRRTATPDPGNATPRSGQTPVDRPRGVYIDPYAQRKSDDARQPASDPSGRRSEPVYLGRPQPVDGPKPDARTPEGRSEPRVVPRVERTPEPRAVEPRAAPSPRSQEPRSAPAPRSAEPRSAPAPHPSSPPPSRPSSSERRRPG
jgi:hypothetical protein